MAEPADTPAGSRSDRGRSSEDRDGGRGSGAVALVIALLACAALVVAVKSVGEEADTAPAAAEPSEKPRKADLTALPASTTMSTIKAAPRDPAPDQATAGEVVHPRSMRAVYTRPGGKAFAKVGPEQFGETWLPVIAEKPGWVQVLLPSKPNHSTGWMTDKGLDRAHSRFTVEVHLGSRTLELFEDRVRVGSWSVAVGAGDTPTPTGRTFLLGQLVDADQSFSPVILPLGTHSQTLDSYGGGPGTVAIHGWTDPSVFGQAISHGCIRVPDDALSELSTIPLGTSVLIDNA